MATEQGGAVAMSEGPVAEAGTNRQCDENITGIETAAGAKQRKRPRWRAVALAPLAAQAQWLDRAALTDEQDAKAPTELGATGVAARQECQDNAGHLEMVCGDTLAKACKHPGLEACWASAPDPEARETSNEAEGPEGDVVANLCGQKTGVVTVSPLTSGSSESVQPRDSFKEALNRLETLSCK